MNKFNTRFKNKWHIREMSNKSGWWTGRCLSRGGDLVPPQDAAVFTNYFQAELLESKKNYERAQTRGLPLLDILNEDLYFLACHATVTFIDPKNL